MTTNNYIRWFEDVRASDVASVGGKNASIGEMISSLKDAGVIVPDGFATTADAYWSFLDQGGLKEKITAELKNYDDGLIALDTAGKNIRRLMRQTKLPAALEEALVDAYGQLCQKYGAADVDVAVRSSATAEDLPEASFAGQQETFLNVTGRHELIESCVNCYASLFTDRAISYRKEKGWEYT